MSIRFEGKHIQNGSSTLVVVMQGAFTKINQDYADKVSAGSIPSEAVKKVHQYYHFMKLSQRGLSADFFYLEDYYSGLYGWYLFDNGRFIYEEISQHLTKMIQQHGYTRVILIGSSKGGAGAVTLGLTNPYIDDVFCLVPDLTISVHPFGNSGKKLFFGGDPDFEAQVMRFFKTEQPFAHLEEKKKNVQFHFFTGVRDYGFQAISQFRRVLTEKYGINNHLMIMPTPEAHSPLIKGHNNLMNELMIDLIQGREMYRTDYFTAVAEATYIVTYKAIGIK